MIVASLLLVIAAAVTLLLGLLDREVIEWVWASIACCLLAGLLLTIGVLRSRPSRKPVLQSGGEGAAASWAGASGYAGNGGNASGAVLTRDEDEADGTVRVGGDAEPLAGNDDPTRTDLPGSADDSNVGASVWAPASDEDTGDISDVRVVPPPAPEPEPEAAAAPQDDVVVVPKPSARGGVSAEDAGAAGPAPASRATPAAKAGGDDAARFEQVLSPISGVGAAKRAALYQHFGTYRKLRAASPEKLAEVPGISRTLADRIHAALHGR